MAIALFVASALDGLLTGSWIHFIHAMHQLQFGVLLGLAVQALPSIAEATSTFHMSLHPIPTSIGALTAKSDIGHLIYNSALLIGFCFLHFTIVVCAFAVLRKRKGYTLQDVNALLRYPNISFIAIALLQAGIAFSATRVITVPNASDSVLPWAIIALATSTVGVLWYLCYFFRHFFVHIQASHWPSDYMKRALPNAKGSQSIIIEARAKSTMPLSFFVYFLPSGYWTSQYLPLRGFTTQFSSLFHGYGDHCMWFLIPQHVRIILTASVLGIERTLDGRALQLWIVLAIHGIHLLTTMFHRPHRSPAHNVMHIAVGTLNVTVLAILVSDETKVAAEYVYFTSLGVYTLLSLMNLAITLVVYLRIGIYGSPSALHDDHIPMISEPIDKALTAQILLLEAEHVGMVNVKTDTLYNKMWCEIRGSYFLYYTENETDVPVGILDLRTCAITSNPKKQKLKFVYLTAEKQSKAVHLTADGPEELQEWVNMAQETHATAASKMANSGVMFATARSIENYDLLEIIGRGACGEVFKARDRATGELWAVKVVNVKEASAAATLNETAVLQVMRHPYIVRLREALHDDDKVYLVMPYLSGGDMSDHIKRSPTGGLFPARVQFYAAEILLAIEHLHANSIMHRDLKPQNVMIHKGHAILTDMGIARIGTTAKTFCGTPLYLAPEVVAHETYNTNVDWWAYGVVLYEMMTGTTPFVASEMSVLFELIQRKTPDLEGVPTHAASLIRLLLDKNPKKRFCNPSKMKRHPFFSGIDWQALTLMQVPPPKGWTIKQLSDDANPLSPLSGQPRRQPCEPFVLE
jgi:hypothetical protein